MADKAEQPSGPDYRDTLFLPETDFPMRAGLPMREPDWLARWTEMDLYGKLRVQARGREKFVLHDGPPYANGHLHIGHALNKVLKDIIIKSQQMMGKDAPYRPGWDCHGLPIEWKIEEQVRAEGLTKDDVPKAEFRKRCREFAAHWIDIQREEFKRLGVLGDWDNPYTTMAFEAEAKIVEEFQKFLMDGSLYRGSKPVMWSVVEKTALAEAEVEYHDHKSITIFVRFPVVKTDNPALEGCSVVIWTTTPWTIPGNRAIAASSGIDYGIYRVDAVHEHSKAEVGEKVVVADALAQAVQDGARITEWTRLGDAGEVVGTVCAHPFRGQGYEFDVPVLDGDFVTTEQGTGFVHCAPGHGQDDYELIRKVGGIEIPFTVEDDGRYSAEVPLFAGVQVMTEDGKDWPANIEVLKALQAAGRLFGKGKLEHSYPHSWRSKAPVIFRNTPQWFVSMEKTGLRDKALKAIADTQFVPEAGRNRLHSMIENRPDWVLSRQRAWGVPLTVFVNKQSGELLQDEAVNARIVEAVRADGADAWFTRDPAEFLGEDYPAYAWEPVTDILDVWFDSGCTHAFVLEDDPDLQWPASLYLEGSDQHRGWFHSSLLESCGTRGRAPYEAVLTHGFVLAEDGRKMSKSLGNQVTPQEIIESSGADILRLWVASSSYSDDLRIGKETLKTRIDAYRKIRNTMRFILGNLAGFDDAERLDPAQMPELDRYMLHRLSELDQLVREGYAAFDFERVYRALFNFCTLDLSAVYFDIRKDALYCDAPASIRRRACRTVLETLYGCLTAWFAPILAFTMEEVWLARNPGDDSSVHLRDFPEIPAGWADAALAHKWASVLKVRRVVTGALEIERREKRIGASLEAAPVIHVTDAELRAALEGLDLAELSITSAATLSADPVPDGAFSLDDVPGVGVVPGLASGEKCARCWMVLDEVGADPAAPQTCRRCASAVKDQAA